MARIRTLKPEFWQDEKLSMCDALTRLVFVGLISQADDSGRIIDSVKLIDGILFPATDDTCAVALDKLAALRRIIRYETSSGQRVIQITGWRKHQKVDRPNPYVLPGPRPEDWPRQQDTEPLASASRSIRDNDASGSRDPRAPTFDPRPSTNDPQQSSVDKSTGAGAPTSFPQSGGERPLHNQFMPLLRELRYVGDKTDGSILKALSEKKVRRADIDRAVRGLAFLRDRGALVESLGVHPADTLNMKMLYQKSVGKMPVWTDAEDEYFRQEKAKTVSRGNGMAQLGSVLQDAMAAAGAET